MLYVMEWEVCVLYGCQWATRKKVSARIQWLHHDKPVFHGWVLYTEWYDRAFITQFICAASFQCIFFFTFYIAFILSISHLCSCLYYICTVQKMHINYPVQNKSKWAQTSYLFMCCVVSCFHNLYMYFLFSFRVYILCFLQKSALLGHQYR